MNYLEFVPEDIVINVLLDYLSEGDMVNILQFTSITIHKNILLRLTKIFDEDALYDLFNKYRNNISYEKIINILYDYTEKIVDTNELIRERLTRKEGESRSDMQMRLLSTPRFGDPQLIASKYIKDKYTLSESELFFKLLLIVNFPEIYKKINLIIHVLENNNPRYHFYTSIVKLFLLIKQQEDIQVHGMLFGIEGTPQFDKQYFDTLNTYLAYISTGEIVSYNLKLYKKIPILIVFINYFERVLLSGRINNKSINRISERMYNELPLVIKNKEFISNILLNPLKYKKLFYL